ncbi:hypothetical protein LTR91_004870 [Friedmanniomyces endolithicus]|uniref:Glycosyl transferase CAP10 domain-containing protein n=1 Tax=Friedmanniomyces endolithicus TaxID=329885 RepID=A0AAN6KV72_9PEZI|nr:hypothetical protein LTR35_008382 [Friedmanniomyces endolithicus]KAK0294867.1 hypothetical protein LTS00_006702 [Friedmanniomyces endolithicus]KAK0926386.1 hypothetical protein LTR57_004243 [Friedmanniomyces endolithicus]KAK0965399.1 hypothetical protein LTS01_018343 [Friedmanniomyces endolithicus]KAK1002140.1 hypothetical protein LTR54_008152 [Friedmanniomyces endolithicus]
MALISAPSVNNRFTQLFIAALLLVGIFWYIVPSSEVAKHISIPGLHSSSSPKPPPSTRPNALPPKPHHPIDHLIAEADVDLKTLLAKETHNVHDAAHAYRLRRGRQPPPHFDEWFAFAQNHSALMVEDFFDQIYTDLNPFWGVPAKQIREQANAFLHRISVRGGKTTQRTDVDERPWLNLWEDMVGSVAEWLPDVDLPINVMDESRVVVPWEEIDGYMQTELASRRVVEAAELKTEFVAAAGSLKALDDSPLLEFDPLFEGRGPYWPLAVVGCSPESPARKAYIETDFSTAPPLTGGFPEGSYEGYVSNWTLAKSPCDNAALQGLHGTFVEPISIATTKKFFPLFGGSKLPMNNEILLPPAMYWTDDPFYSGGKEHGQAWDKKRDGMIWRGAASGGRNKAENWKRFQRHRFVSMVNSTSVRTSETSGNAPQNFVLPAHNPYDLAVSPNETSFADWLSTWSNAAVVHLLCFPENPADRSHCSYTDRYFSVAHQMPMKEQYAYKYLPDIDGNSFSGRYRAFLFSTSLPIKATIYQEWHDSRLVPWRHFVPVDNTFADVYGIMEYFLGNEGMRVGGHDEVAREIAMGGKAWAEKVLRREDMQIYTFRLLLEYARLCDEERERMGWRESGVG